MLCVIPDNKDKSLIKSTLPVPDFWDKLFLIESRGATIIHGLEHKLGFSKIFIVRFQTKLTYMIKIFITKTNDFMAYRF